MNVDVALMVAIAVVVVLLVVGVVFAMRQRDRQRLKQRFGPEYERAVRTHGDASRAEAELQSRERRVASLDIHPLTAEQRERFGDSWKRVQVQFVDDPRGAVTQADRLVGEVMLERGYPVGDFEQRAADISVDHPHVVENYRAARAIAQRHARGEAGTEDLRQAMVHYRALFADLLEGRQEAGTRRRGGNDAAA